MQETLLKKWRDQFATTLSRFSEVAYSESIDLHEACRYALAGEGKHIRPLLTILTAEMCGGDGARALPAAVAVEMIHTYSLVHDDLPCMDDDDLRRGRPTLHKVYGDATALLAGDALLTDAFHVITAPESLASIFPTHPSAQARLAQAALLAKAAGGHGMVLGQSLDMHWTAREGAQSTNLDHIHRHKTGYLIAAACAMGVRAAEGPEHQAEKLWLFGEKIGLAFQICDDLLDNAEGTGKSQGKDESQGKLTYLRFQSRNDAAAAATRLTREAEDILKEFGDRAAPLSALTAALLQRQK